MPKNGFFRVDESPLRLAIQAGGLNKPQHDNASRQQLQIAGTIKIPGIKYGRRAIAF